MNDSVAASALVSATASVTVFPALLPKLSDVRKSTRDAAMVNDVRMGEAIAFGIVSAIGFTASALTDSPVPVMIAIASATALVITYESVLSATPKERSNG